jgi:acetyl esterase/lipase
MPHLTAFTDLPFGHHIRQSLDLFVPARADDAITVVCVHGGWWSAGHHHDLRAFALHLAELGFPAATVGHRFLGNDVKGGQEIVDDVRAAAQRAVEEASLLGADPASVVLLGSGSGSLVALAAAHQMIADRACRLRVRAAIACGVTPSLEPWDGCPIALTKALHAFAAGRETSLSPIDLAADAFPPLLLLHGDADAEVPAKAAAKLHARVADTGEISVHATIAGVGHQFIEQPFDRQARQAVDRIVPFLTEHTARPTVPVEVGERR